MTFRCTWRPDGIDHPAWTTHHTRAEAETQAAWLARGYGILAEVTKETT